MKDGPKDQPDSKILTKRSVRKKFFCGQLLILEPLFVNFTINQRTVPSFYKFKINCCCKYLFVSKFIFAWIFDLLIISFLAYTFFKKAFAIGEIQSVSDNMVPYQAWTQRNTTNFCAKINENGGDVTFWEGDTDDVYGQWSVNCDALNDIADNKV